MRTLLAGRGPFVEAIYPKVQDVLYPGSWAA